MSCARRHQRFLAVLAFGLLALVAELVGRSLTQRIDVGRHVAAPSYSGASYYPFLVGAVKVGVALMLARVAWRFAKARATARAARRLASALGVKPHLTAPRVRLQLPARRWLVAFLVTASIYLVQTDAEHVAAGRWPPLAPWLHSSALPVFAVLAVVVTLLYGAAELWLGEYERYARETADLVRALAGTAPPPPVAHSPSESIAPRRRFGVAFEVRPPPAPA
ncbi:MAG TPA: hypothetical protein VGF23_22905 [Gaiellaceae bacterium]|jgi:hypothetical protein